MNSNMKKVCDELAKSLFDLTMAAGDALSLTITDFVAVVNNSDAGTQGCRDRVYAAHDLWRVAEAAVMAGDIDDDEGEAVNDFADAAIAFADAAIAFAESTGDDTGRFSGALRIRPALSLSAGLGKARSLAARLAEGTAES